MCPRSFSGSWKTACRIANFSGSARSSKVRSKVFDSVFVQAVTILSVAGHIQRRVFEVPGILRELFQSLAEVFLFLFVLEAEVALLPDIGEAGRAGGFERAFIETIALARRIVLYRGRMVDEAAKIDEMLLRRLPLGERDGLPFPDELMRGHAKGLARVGGRL